MIMHIECRLMRGHGGCTVGWNASESDLQNLAINSPLPASKRIRAALRSSSMAHAAEDACRRGSCIRLRACGITGQDQKNCVP